MVKVGERCPCCGEVKGFTPNYAKIGETSIFSKGVNCFRCGDLIDLEDTASYVLVIAPEDEWIVCGDCHGEREVS